MRCHSVRSCFCPCLSVQFSLVAMVKFATACPLGVYRTSGSLPRLPIRMTLLTPLPAIARLASGGSGTLAQGADKRGPRIRLDRASDDEAIRRPERLNGRPRRQRKQPRERPPSHRRPERGGPPE